MPKKKLEQKIYVIPNVDKGSWVEKWYSGRSMLSIPHPMGISVSGKTNSGKSNLIKNIILQHLEEKRPFERIMVLHCDPNNKEYDCVGAEVIDYIPTIDDLDPNLKNLLIVDDYAWDDATRTERKNIDRAWGFLRTHCSLSVVIVQQLYFRIPCNLRRMCDTNVFYCSSDIMDNRAIAIRLGLRPDTWVEFLKKHCKSRYDFIMIDNSKGCPHRVKFNGFTHLPNALGLI